MISWLGLRWNGPKKYYFINVFSNLAGERVCTLRAGVSTEGATRNEKGAAQVKMAKAFWKETTLSSDRTICLVLQTACLEPWTSVTPRNLGKSHLSERGIKKKGSSIYFQKGLFLYFYLSLCCPNTLLCTNIKYIILQTNYTFYFKCS
jgi:hypothetical protein